MSADRLVMQHHDATDDATDASPDEEELTEEQRTAMDRALEQRRNGGSRSASLDELTAAGIGQGAAEVMIDGFDELMGVLHGFAPDDVSDKVAATLDEKVPAEKRRRPLTKPVEELVESASKMAVQGRSKSSIVQYLTENGASQEEANQLAAKFTMQVSAARAKFDESKRKAMNSAMWKIGGGIAILIVGLVIMGSGADTSSSRRSPVGVVIAAVVMIGAGLKDLASVQDQTFERRVAEVMR